MNGQSPLVPRPNTCYIMLSQVPDGSGVLTDPINGPIPIPSVPYRVFTDFLRKNEVKVPGAPASGPVSDQNGILTIPWSPKPDANNPDDVFMVLEMFDTVYRITLLPTLTPLDPSRPPDVLTLQKDRKQARLPPPDLTLQAIQERLDILGYIRCYGDNDGVPTRKSFIDGINDEPTEEGILNFQHDRSIEINGMPDAVTLTSLAEIMSKKGY